MSLKKDIDQFLSEDLPEECQNLQNVEEEDGDIVITFPDVSIRCVPPDTYPKGQFQIFLPNDFGDHEVFQYAVPSSSPSPILSLAKRVAQECQARCLLKSSGFGQQSDEDEGFGILTSSQASVGDGDGDWSSGEENIKVNEDLERDIAWFRTMFGDEGAIEVSYKPLLETVEVQLCFDLHHIIQESTAEIWGIPHTNPMIYVQFVFSTYYLKDNTAPKISVFQLVDADKDAVVVTKKRITMGVCFQIQNILRTYVENLWRAESRVTLVSTIDPSNDQKIHKKKAPRKEQKGFEKKMEDGTIVDDVLLNELKKNFPAKSSQELANALVLGNHNVDAAIRILSGESNAESPAPLVKETSTQRIVSWITGNKKQKHKNDAKTQKVTESRLQKSLELDTNQKDELQKSVDRTHGFFCLIYSFTVLRIPSLHHHCIICDENHLFEGGLVKPAVCSRNLCMYVFQQLGIGADGATEMAVTESVVDLLLTLFKVAAKTHRKTAVLEPFPTIFDHKNKSILVLDPAARDYAKLTEILASIPSMSEMGDLKNLKTMLDMKHEYAYTLVNWVINSNRCFIVKLQKQSMIKSMLTPHQFLMLSDAPEKEVTFRNLKQQHGSFFLYHGSPIENWHSILRNGLKNMSGTKGQLHGAAYGNGIYLSNDSNLSFGYCRNIQGQNINTASKNFSLATNHFIQSEDHCICIALCEVIDKKDEMRISNNIYVVPNENYVCTRLFFVFERETVRVDSTSQAFTEEVRQAIRMYNGSG